MDDSDERESKSRAKKRAELEAAHDKIEEDPAVERGERIATGKQIARGGKAIGHVPGAAETKAAQ